MGSSQKKKKEKQKDFQKPKLKVGKAKPKAANVTDTSFKSKSIVLKQQTLSTTAPSTTQQFSHYLSLVNAKSDSQRKDALAYLTSSITSRPVDSSLPQPVSVMLLSLAPLILDGSNGVRTQLVKLLRTLPNSEVEGHVSLLLPYIRAGMTHLASDIRVSSVETLSWLLATAGQEVVASEGGWAKTLNCFLSLLGWHTEESAKWSSSRASFGKAGTEGKPMARAMQVLTDFLRIGIGHEEDDDGGAYHNGQELDFSRDFPLHDTLHHFIPDKSAPFAYLSLFGQPKDDESQMYESSEDRLRVFTQKYQQPVERGLNAAKKDGGEIGRAAAGLGKVLRDAAANTAQL